MRIFTGIRNWKVLVNTIAFLEGGTKTPSKCASAIGLMQNIAKATRGVSSTYAVNHNHGKGIEVGSEG